MPIPNLNADGLLPMGVHECTMDEIEGRFGQFQRSNRRCQLYDKLAAYVDEAQATGLVIAVIIDGSFVTSKEIPNDIDLIVVLSMNHDFFAQIHPFEYNVLSRRRVSRQYGFDVLLAQDGQPELDEYLRFFSQVRGEPTHTKGMLRVTL